MPFARPFKVLACLSLAVCAAQSAHAVPITYQFTTDPFGTLPSIATGPSATAIAAALYGLSVSGTFVYDSDSPLTDVTDSAQVIGEHNYDGNPIADLSANIGTLDITGATGKADVADDGYVSHVFPNPDPVYGDFLHFVSITDKGISLLGLPLVTARLFWIESPGPISPTPDFLTSGDLPDSLKSLSHERKAGTAQGARHDTGRRTLRGVHENRRVSARARRARAPACNEALSDVDSCRLDATRRSRSANS
jgi:hypothetical protein